MIDLGAGIPRLLTSNCFQSNIFMKSGPLSKPAEFRKIVRYKWCFDNRSRCLCARRFTIKFHSHSLSPFLLCYCAHRASIGLSFGTSQNLRDLICFSFIVLISKQLPHSSYILFCLSMCVQSACLYDRWRNETFLALKDAYKIRLVAYQKCSCPLSSSRLTPSDKDLGLNADNETLHLFYDLKHATAFQS